MFTRTNKNGPRKFSGGLFGRSGSFLSTKQSQHMEHTYRSEHVLLKIVFHHMFISNQGHLHVRIFSGATVKLLSPANKRLLDDIAAPFPRRLFLLLPYFEVCTVSCSERRDRAVGRGIIMDCTPLSLHGSRPRKFSWWCCASRVRLMAR